MKTVRFTANILFYITRISGLACLVTALYALIIVVSSLFTKASWLPINIRGNYFTIFYPFTRKAFLLGDYSLSYLCTNLFSLTFYGFFLWLLSGVFDAFRQKKLFTLKGVVRLSRFYITNLIVPFLFLLLVLVFRDEFNDLIRIMVLHLIIGVFAFFMAAIFKQAMVLQEEHDLTF